VLDTVKADEKQQANAAPAAVSVAPPVPADHDSHTSPDTDAKRKPATKLMSPPENHDAAKPPATQAPAPALEGKATPEAAPKMMPAPSATTAAKPDVQGASPADIGTLVKTMVGDLARAGMLKDPEFAGHIAADAIIAAERPVQPAKPLRTDDTDQAPPNTAPKAAA